MTENEGREVYDVTEENDGDMNMATLMEDMGSEFGSLNGLQDVHDSSHENEGTMVILEEANIVADVRTTIKPLP